MMQIDQLCAVLGEGAENVVYSLRSEPNLVLKVAKSDNEKLHKQANILSTLESTALFPKVFSKGKMQVGMHLSTNQPVERSFLVMEKLGISLEEFMILRHGNINFSTIMKIGIQILHKIRVLHSVDIIHNDIKPSNLLFGLKEKRSELYIIDFGMSEKQQQNSSNLSHNDSDIVDPVFKGNIKFSSLRKLRGHKSKKIDDLQSLLYLLIWLILGGKNMSQIGGFDKRTDHQTQSLKQRLLFQFEAKKYFIQNAQTLLRQKLNQQRLGLLLMLCSLLQLLIVESNQQRLEFFYDSISHILSPHK